MLEGVAYETAIGLLTWQLRQSHPSAATGRFEIYGATYGRPVIDQWHQTLQPVHRTVFSRRRVRRLLRTLDREDLLEVLRGPDSMHVAVLKNDNGDLYFNAEWPHDPLQGWNERTIIAADRDSAGAVFALTPTAAGAGPAEIKRALWQVIATTNGPLRLPWPTVLQWARADAVKADYTGNA